jgi:hypothetical protein
LIDCWHGVYQRTIKPRKKREEEKNKPGMSIRGLIQSISLLGSLAREFK